MTPWGGRVSPRWRPAPRLSRCSWPTASKTIDGSWPRSRSRPTRARHALTLHSRRPGPGQPRGAGARTRRARAQHAAHAVRAPSRRAGEHGAGPARRAASPSPHAHLSHRRTPDRSQRSHPRPVPRLLGRHQHAASSSTCSPDSSRPTSPTGPSRPCSSSRSCSASRPLPAATSPPTCCASSLFIGVVLLVVAFAANWQVVTYWVLVTAAVLVLLVNLRDVLRR